MFSRLQYIVDIYYQVTIIGLEVWIIFSQYGIFVLQKAVILFKAPTVSCSARRAHPAMPPSGYTSDFRLQTSASITRFPHHTEELNQMKYYIFYNQSASNLKWKQNSIQSFELVDSKTDIFIPKRVFLYSTCSSVLPASIPEIPAQCIEVLWNIDKYEPNNMASCLMFDK